MKFINILKTSCARAVNGTCSNGRSLHSLHTLIIPSKCRPRFWQRWGGGSEWQLRKNCWWCQWAGCDNAASLRLFTAI